MDLLFFITHNHIITKHCKKLGNTFSCPGLFRIRRRLFWVFGGGQWDNEDNKDNENNNITGGKDPLIHSARFYVRSVINR